MKKLTLYYSGKKKTETFENVSNTYVEDGFYNIKQVLDKVVVVTSIPVSLIERAVLSRAKR